MSGSVDGVMDVARSLGALSHWKCLRYQLKEESRRGRFPRA